MAIGNEERAAFRDMAASFARRSIGPVLEHDSPDGDLDRVPGVLDQARETGLLTSTDPSAPGYEAGVWGRHVLDQGPEVSLMLLEELAVSCAGVAMNLHVTGLGCHAVAMARNLPEPVPDRPAAAICENGFLPGPAVIKDPSRNEPAAVNTTAEKKGGDYLISGEKNFVYAGHGADGFVVFAREGQEWAAFLVPVETPGLTVRDAGHRMGLRACPLYHIKLEGVKVPEGNRLSYPGPVSEVVSELMRLFWLGAASMGAGAARGALAEARAYAAERYQGGTEIINHPGVNAMLLGSSEAAIDSCRAIASLACAEGGSRKGLLAAARAKLEGIEVAARAVTDCLQVFGGYGYMEDYPMEKRYRDINTLRYASGGPRELRLMIAGLSEEE